MITVWVIDGSAVNPNPEYEKKNAAISDPAIAPLTAAFDESGSFILLAQRPLNMFGVVQMRDECRAHFNQQRFQFVILGIGNERVVERIQYGLVIGHLVIDVSFVKGFSREALEFLDRIGAARGQAPACIVLLGFDFELRHQINSRFIDTGMVSNHSLCKCLDLLVFGLRFRQFAGVDVDLVCRYDNRRNLGIVGAIRMRRSAKHQGTNGGGSYEKQFVHVDTLIQG